MKKFYQLAAVAAGMLTATGAYAQAAPTPPPTISVITWIAPNASGSPNFTAAAQNQFNAVYAGASSAGTPGTPTYYQAITGPVSYGANIVTNFNSWQGVADPGAPYQNEYGNRTHFGLVIDGHGTSQFSISQLTFATSSNGSNEFLYDFGPGYQYSAGYVGILYGADHALGGGDDTFITSGLDTQLVDGLIGRGSGLGDEITCGSGGTTSGPCGAGNQSYINDEIARLQADGFTQLYGTYGLLDGNGGTVATGSGTVTFAAVPEPATWTMMILGFGLVGASVRRRRSDEIAALA